MEEATLLAASFLVGEEAGVADLRPSCLVGEEVGVEVASLLALEVVEVEEVGRRLKDQLLPFTSHRVRIKPSFPQTLLIPRHSFAGHPARASYPPIVRQSHPYGAHPAPNFLCLDRPDRHMDVWRTQVSQLHRVA